MPYVYSTFTNPVAYVEYEEPSEASKIRGYNIIVKKVVIKGGHGLATKQLVTPRGVVTQVNESDMDFLLQNKLFQQHVKAEFIAYDKKRIDPEKKAKNMADKDGSAPLTPEDFKDGKLKGRLYEPDHSYV